MNYTVFQWINDWAGHWPWLDRLMIFSANEAPYWFALLLALLWIYFAQKKNEKQQRTVIYALLAIALGLLVNLPINRLYFHPRPFVDHTVHQLIAHSALESSFASDHAILAFSAAFMLLVRKSPLAYAALLAAVWTGLSRIYVGVHYPFDIVGAIVIAAVSCTAVLALKNLLEPAAGMLIRLYAKFVALPKSVFGKNS